MRRTSNILRPRLESLDDRCLLSTLTVTNNLDRANSATFPPAGSLRYEINVAQSGDTIVFDRSLNGQIITLSGDDLAIDKNLTIAGPGSGLLTISGGGGSRVFEVDSGAVTLSGLTISGGTGERSSSGSDPYIGYGGGILNLAPGTLTLSGCVVSHNRTSYEGGGVANLSTMTIANSTVSNNTSEYRGGGIDNNGTMTITGSTVVNNTAPYGFNNLENDGILTVKKSKIAKN
jgi:hypothetical protein